jgi:hypothetical protein
MLSALREEIIDKAEKTAEAMKSVGTQYQSLVRDPNLCIRQDEPNDEARRRLVGECRDFFLREPHRIARKLQVAGYDTAAGSLRQMSNEMRKFSLMEISWSDDDSYTLEIDVQGASERVTQELDQLRAQLASVHHGHQLNDSQLAALADAANLADERAWIAKDYLIYFEGWLPAGYDPAESDADRMRHARGELAELRTETIIRDCEQLGFLPVAQALTRLLDTTASVLKLTYPDYPSPAAESPRSPSKPDGEPGRGREVDTDQLRDEIDLVHRFAIEAILDER